MNNIVIYPINVDIPLQTLTNHTDRITSFTICSNVSQMISSSYDGTSKQWDIETGTMLRNFIGHNGPIYQITSYNNRFLSISEDRTLKEWCLTSGQCIKNVMNSNDDCFMSLYWEGNKLFTGSRDGIIKNWDPQLNYGRCLGALEGHEGSVISLSCEGKRLISGSSNGFIKFWNTDTLQCVKNEKRSGAICSLQSNTFYLVNSEGKDVIFHHYGTIKNNSEKRKNIL